MTIQPSQKVGGMGWTCHKFPQSFGFESPCTPKVSPLVAGYLGFSCSRFWQYSTSPPVKLLTCLTSMLLHMAHVAFLWSFGELTSSIESISHKQRGVMGKHVTHTPLNIHMEHNSLEGWKIIFLSKWVMAVGSMIIFQGVYNLTGKCGNPLLAFRRWHGRYLSISSRMIYTIHGCYWNRFFVNVLTTIDLLSNSTRWAPTTYKYVYTSRCYNPSYPFIMQCKSGVIKVHLWRSSRPTSYLAIRVWQATRKSRHFLLSLWFIRTASVSAWEARICSALRAQPSWFFGFDPKILGKRDNLHSLKLT